MQFGLHRPDHLQGSRDWKHFGVSSKPYDPERSMGQLKLVVSFKQSAEGENNPDAERAHSILLEDGFIPHYGADTSDYNYVVTGSQTGKSNEIHLAVNKDKIDQLKPSEVFDGFEKFLARLQEDQQLQNQDDAPEIYKAELMNWQKYYNMLGFIEIDKTRKDEFLNHLNRQPEFGQKYMDIGSLPSPNNSQDKEIIVFGAHDLRMTQQAKVMDLPAKNRFKSAFKLAQAHNHDNIGSVGRAIKAVAGDGQFVHSVSRLGKQLYADMIRSVDALKLKNEEIRFYPMVQTPEYFELGLYTERARRKASEGYRPDSLALER